LEILKRRKTETKGVGEREGERRRYSHMPNFSHGTSGVAFFLSSLYSVTQNTTFLEPAKKGASYLRAVANRYLEAKIPGWEEREREPNRKGFLGKCSLSLLRL
jgi:lantibiotic modifying enzyme